MKEFNDVLTAIEKAKEHNYYDVVLPVPDVVEVLKNFGYTVTLNKDETEMHIQWK